MQWRQMVVMASLALALGVASAEDAFYEVPVNQLDIGVSARINDRGDGILLVDTAGGTGTLLELATVWELENKGFLDRGKPIILVGGFWRPLVDLVATDDPRCAESVVWAEGPEQVVQRIKENLGM